MSLPFCKDYTTIRTFGAYRCSAAIVIVIRRSLTLIIPYLRKMFQQLILICVKNEKKVCKIKINLKGSFSF